MKHIKLFEGYNGYNLEPHKTEEIDTEKEKALAKTIEDELRKLFPDSNIVSRYERGQGHYIYVGFTLGKDKTEYVNNIWNNDVVAHKLMFHIKNNTYSSSRLEGTIYTKPEPGSYLAAGRIKTPWREFSTQDGKVVVKKVVEYFTKLKQLLIDNVDKLQDFDADLVRKKLIKGKVKLNENNNSSKLQYILPYLEEARKILSDVKIMDAYINDPEQYVGEEPYFTIAHKNDQEDMLYVSGTDVWIAQDLQSELPLSKQIKDKKITVNEFIQLLKDKNK